MIKETSRMIIIPEEEKNITFAAITSMLSNIQNKNISISNIDKKELHTKDDEIHLLVDLCVDDNTYHVTIYPVPVIIPEFFRTTHAFSELDFQKIDKINIGLMIAIDYTNNFLQSYHDQLKIVDMLVPNSLAVIDIPSEKILSGKWIRLAASSSVPPSPKYLFSVQAILEDTKDEVWLHSHGLKRCGLPELEILCSTKSLYSQHVNIIETLAISFIEHEKALEPYDYTLLAWLTDEIAMIATIVDYNEALEYYPQATLCTKESRDTYHSEGTYAIMLYLSVEDVTNKKPTPIQALDDYIADNPIYMFSNRETNRMRNLARERIDYCKLIFNNPNIESSILLKIGLPRDKEYLEPNVDPKEQYEHIWFELKKIEKRFTKESFICELTQEPYYINNMHTGYIGKYSLGDITDWMIFINGDQLTPDDIYKIVM